MRAQDVANQREQIAAVDSRIQDSDIANQVPSCLMQTSLTIHAQADQVTALALSLTVSVDLSGYFPSIPRPVI